MTKMHSLIADLSGRPIGDGFEWRLPFPPAPPKDSVRDWLRFGCAQTVIALPEREALPDMLASILGSVSSDWCGPPRMLSSVHIRAPLVYVSARNVPHIIGPGTIVIVASADDLTAEAQAAVQATGARLAASYRGED